MLRERHGPVFREIVRRMGRDGWLGVGWPVEYGGQGFGGDRAAALRRRGVARRRPAAVGDAADRRADAAAVRHGRAEGLLPAQDPGRRDPLRDRLHRAGGGHRPRGAADHGGARRRRVRRQRPEDLHHRRPRRRLHLARLPDRAGRAAAQGHLDPHRGHQRPRLLLDADHHLRRRPPRQRDVLLGRSRAGEPAGGQGERGLAADHHAAQPRAGHARPGRADRRPVRPGPRLGRRARRPAGPRRRRGAVLAEALRGDAGQRAAELAGRGRPRRARR